MIKQWDNTILLEPDNSPEYKERAVEFARFMGFQTEAAEFPVTSSKCGIKGICWWTETWISFRMKWIFT